MFHLRHVYVENFKSIKALDLELTEGFFMITGPNGSGKSNLLESISFGLGVKIMELSLNNMVSNLSGLDNGTDAKTVVMLTFHSNMNSSIVIGSGIVQGHRQYYIGNTVTTKEKFMTVVHEKIGFGKECSSWNIGQYAVQDIISATPPMLFDILSHVAGTNVLLDTKVEAEKQIDRFRIKLTGMDQALKQLKILLDKFEVIRDELGQLSTLKIQKLDCDGRIELIRRIYALIPLYNLHISLESQRVQLKATDEELVRTMKLQKEDHLAGASEKDRYVLMDAARMKLKNEVQQLENTCIHRKELLSSTCEAVKRAKAEQDSILLGISQITSKINQRQSHRQHLVEEEFSRIFSSINMIESSIEAVSFKLLGDGVEDVLKRKNIELMHLKDEYKTQQTLLLSISSAGIEICRNHDVLKASKLKIDVELQDNATMLRKRYDELVICCDLDHHSLTLVAMEESLRITAEKRQHASCIIQVKGDELKTLLSEKSFLSKKLKLPDIDHIFDSGDAGKSFRDAVFLLSDVLCPFVDRASLRHASQLLAVLQHQLGICICVSDGAAAFMLERCQAAGIEIRIWPLVQLLEKEHSSGSRTNTEVIISRILSHYSKYNNTLVLNPQSLIEHSNLIPPCFLDVFLQKVFGDWIFADSDEIATELMMHHETTNIRRCVSIDGKKHVRGSLLVNWRNYRNDCSIVHAWKKYHSLNAKLTVLSKSYNESKECEAGLFLQQERISVICDCLRSQDHLVSEKLKICQQLTEYNEAENDNIIQMEVARRRLKWLEGSESELEDNIAAIKASQDPVACHLKLDRQMLEKVQSEKRDVEKSIVELDEGIIALEMSLVEQKDSLYLDEELSNLELKYFDAMEKNIISRKELTSKHCELVELDAVWVSLQTAVAHHDGASCSLSEKVEMLESKQVGLSTKKKEMEDRIKLLTSELFQKKSGQCGFDCVQNELSSLIQSAKKSMKLMVDAETIETAGLITTTQLENCRTIIIQSVEALGDTKDEMEQSSRKLEHICSLVAENTALSSVSWKQVQSGACTEGQFNAEMIGKKAHMSNLIEKYNQISQSISMLDTALLRIDELTAESHRYAYKQLRSHCLKYCQDLVPNMSIDLLPVGDKPEGGLVFKVVRSAHGAGGLSAGVSSDDLCYSSVNELSGGQKGMVGLAFMLACCSLHHKPAPLYILDEVDAAFDEANQKRVARLIGRVFKNSQVLSVSHHSEFQLLAEHTISVCMKDGQSEIRQTK